MTEREEIVRYVGVAVICLVCAVTWAVQDDAWARGKCAARLTAATTRADSAAALDSRPQWLSRRYAERCRVLMMVR